MPFQPLEPTDPPAVGPYLLLARLGAGGMGRVYLARSAGGRTVAVKVVRSELAEDQEFRERFRREVAAAQAVSGVYTAPVVDADRDGPNPWLATAYVLGPSLTEAVAAHGPLPVAAVRALGAGLAQALSAVHAAGLVHRDLKPSNVLLAADGPRVIDFGIARALDGDRLTSTGVVVGSPGFMCPEQAAGAPMGPSGDVFSLGSVLVYAATGAGPFSQDTESAGSAAALLYRVIHDEPALDALPAELRPAVTACLAKNPADRPTPAELVDLLSGGRTQLRSGWLPSELSSDIATHAAAVMDLETPARGSSAPPADPRLTADHPPTRLDAAAPAEHTVKLTGSATPPEPPAQAPAGPSRRLLLAGGGAALLAALGGAAWALTDRTKPLQPVPTPTGLLTAPAPTPTAVRAPGMPPVALWNFTLPQSAGGNSLPICVGDVVLLDSDGLFALGRTDGKQRWTDPQAAGGIVVAAGGTISYAAADIVTADPASGALLWKYTPQKLANPSQLLESSTILAADDRAVYALCSYLLLDGEGLPTSDPLAPGILALSRKDGSVLWSQHRAANADTDVMAVLAGDTLLYTDSKTNLVARSTSTGQQLWFADTEAQALYPPATDGDRVYCSAPGLGVQAVAVSGGKQVWTKAAPQKRLWYAPPTVAGGVVYTVLGGMTVTLDGTLYTPPAGPVLIAYRATDGAELWRLALPSECSMNTPSIVVQDTLFVPTDSKGIYAVDIKAHTIRWIFQNGVTTDVEWQFGTDGKQLIAVQDNRVYALPLV
ncbi:serine/threonine protein kinase/outer membrane protein assembly factor BamB [Kitasatospora sp. MAP12-15]|uniref:serine/threonine-protein kinase n=1 Tax=unclassified Kitasatospora TaxID=2633591 RepID=UPI0024769122|nr:serine/threonine-protein kinase [Kitasatospora sp. MAP12-44]MDH6110393.1 serine/threonine protein kinase/outer membrane protein assembly factor BamB [Kitasatospora sp. MAP12-44]